MRDMTGKQLGWLCAVMALVCGVTGCTARVSTGTQSMRDAATPPAAQQNSAVVEAKPEWFGCKTDADCTVETGLCGRHQGVNRSFVMPFQQYRERMEQVIRCMPNTDSVGKEEATCLKQRCAVKSQIGKSN